MTQPQTNFQLKTNLSSHQFQGVDNATTQFPEISGRNLLRQSVQFPDAFEGSLNIVFIAFQRWQQNDIDSWLPFISELETSHPHLVIYELPVIYEMNRLSQFFLNEGMRAGIPNDDTRAHTITLYTDKKAFRRQLQLPTESTMYLLLVDQKGQDVWRSEGPFTHTKATNLVHQIEIRS